MTYPPTGGSPDPYQPQQPYDPTAPYAQDPYAPPPSSGAPSSGQPYPPPFGDASKGQPYPPPYGGQPYSGQPYSGQPYPPYGPPSRTNGLAIASLICSLAGFATCISAPAGVVLGHIARRQIRETGEGGEGMAVAGLWIGYILSGLFLIFAVLWAILLAAGIWGASNSSTY